MTDLRSILILVALGCICSCLRAQPLINKAYGERTANSGYSVIPEENGYLMVGMGLSSSYNPTGNLKVLKFCRVDSSGNTIWQKEFGKEHCSFQPDAGNGSVKSRFGGYVVCGDMWDSVTNLRTAMLLRLDDNGDTLWTRRFGGSSFDKFNCCVEEPNGDIVAAGLTTNMGDVDGDVYVVRVDRYGGLKWQRAYGGSRLDYALMLASLPNGDLVVSGGSESFSGSGAVQNYGIRTDSMGSVIWSRVYGPVGFRAGPSEIIPSRYGGFWMWGTWDTLSTIMGVTYVARLDDGGNIVNRLLFEETTGITLWQCRELADGRLVVIGAADVLPTHNSFGGYIAELDSSLSVNWERVISYEGPDIDSAYRGNQDGQFYGFAQCTDSGYVIVGTTAYRKNNGVNYQGMWLVKTNAVGCLDASCGYIGIDDISFINIEMLKIFPNPTHGIANLSWQPSIQNQPTCVQMYDLLGRRVYDINTSENNASISLMDWQTGIYIIKAMTGNIVRIGKLIVE